MRLLFIGFILLLFSCQKDVNLNREGVYIGWSPRYSVTYDTSNGKIIDKQFLGYDTIRVIDYNLKEGQFSLIKNGRLWDCFIHNEDQTFESSYTITGHFNGDIIEFQEFYSQTTIDYTKAKKMN